MTKVASKSQANTGQQVGKQFGVLRSVAHALAIDPAMEKLERDPSGIIACAENVRPALVAALGLRHPERTIVIVTRTGTAAQLLHDDLLHYLGNDDALLFPAWETLPFERISPAIETMGRRLEVLWRVRGDQPPLVVVASIRALLQKLGPGAETFEPIEVVRGSEVDADSLLARLVGDGYRREQVVEHRGEVARRGSIIDVFPSTADAPIRIDLWGDEVDRLATFNVNDQRSTLDLDRVTIYPARELRVDESVMATAESLMASEPWGVEHWDRFAHSETFEGMESWLPWLAGEDRLLTDVIGEHRGSNGAVVFVDQRRVLERATDLIAEEDDLANALASTWKRASDSPFPRLHLEPERLMAHSAGTSSILLAPIAEAPDAPAINSSAWGVVTGDIEATALRVNEMLSDKWTIVFAADGDGTADRLVEAFREHGVTIRRRDHTTSDDLGGGASVVVAPLNNGFLLSQLRVAVVAESDLTGRRRTRRTPRVKRTNAASVFEDLKPGDYVVHHHHGVGRYEGMVKRAIGDSERDYLLIAYKGEDKLYVPTDHIDSVRQYVGGEAPTLHKLGGSDFARTKSRVRSAVREIAQELVVLYQRRVNATGHTFALDTPWQHEMEAAFPYVETPDQRDAIEAVKHDMETSVPMDRLVCGDVGFGKTEVAVRAAFKCIQDGKQAAVLVPTTLLASQHGITFRERFAGYPIRVEVLSRFLTTAEAKKVIKGLASGEIDCVIGTHRLLQEGVAFKDLGLLVIDEEQRFGVQHKELMKKLRTNVDVLTLSATPIPRTLEMSLVGIRDLSLLQTPPADRQPILTFVGEYDERVATEAIRRELLRDGQVFWVHNRVQSIEDRARELRELVPEARIAVAHGQMDESTLERTVVDFWEGKFDVLVCTTIIESGIDMPTVNTLVVERADLLGLGQMHQLRGRVGRSGSRAYAYLFHPRGRALGEEAYERLKTIGETTDLGSGFKIAMRDLEIRGAGNLLGEAQSGHIAAVGYDLYCQLVTEAVAEMKGEEPQALVPELRLDVATTAHLPNEYVPKEEMRLDAYRRLAQVRTMDDVEDIRREWLDRYGPLPAPAEELIEVGRLRAECHRIGINELSVQDARARISPITLKASAAMRLSRLAPSSRYDEKTHILQVPLPRSKDPRKPEHVSFLVGFLAELIETPN